MTPQDRDLKEQGKAWLAKMGRAPTDCGVDGCESSGAEVVELLPLDPIDHGSTLIQLCPYHQSWAEERNALAEAVTEELRERRQEIGNEHADEIARLATPQEGELAEEILQGDVESIEAFDGEVIER